MVRSHLAQRVSSELARSWLLVSARETTRFEDATGSATDRVILDIEDAIDPMRKDSARAGVIAWLSGAGSAWVRINDRASDFWAADVDGLRGVPGLQGVVLAKVESATAVTETFEALGGRVPVVALIESALGIEESVAIARARGAHRLAFGSGDYRRDTGTSTDDLAMAYPRSKLVVASRIGGLPGPIDGPTVAPGHVPLREQAAVAVSLGMTGKLCLFAEQAPVVNEAFGPSASDLSWAREFLLDFDEAGGAVRDGSDPPRLARARRIQELARAFAIA
ncbi:HpcH/HpaI aldolase/citrate lyase family protein [Agromyces sp. MMS24-JH15]|uniref:HpcH/HpaI aldolase/citrate lyase family protein n=1 Tax=Agromyces sp. MMS24-JH15 TaxID=3243765 RepID=UPI0037486FCD